MYAIEFEATVNNGIIEIPEKYRAKVMRNVKVILLAEDVTEKKASVIDTLLESPIQISDFTPFERNEIYERS